MRGDAAEAALWARALELVRALRIESEADTGPLFDHPPADCDPEILKRLRQMYEAGGWVLVEPRLVPRPIVSFEPGRYRRWHSERQEVRRDVREEHHEEKHEQHEKKHKEKHHEH